MLAHASQVKRKTALALVAVLLTPVSFAQNSSIDERPDPFAMTGDLLVARPIGLAMTAVGAAAFVISLPFTVLAGSVSETAESLVLGPAESTFMRCLGCRVTGYSYKDAERRRNRDLRHAEEAAAAAAAKEDNMQ